MSDTKQLWEILVPTLHQNGNPIRTRFHRVWDAKVYEITGGLTILTPAKGKWVPQAGGVIEERMIPVRIACTREQIEKIVDMTIEYYDQQAVLAYRISEEVILKYAKEKKNEAT
jgi:hypothetical protein